jgi:2-amino-4-hydroxy-6-hydroxymethyldihydropteridine diphosphokinase
MSDFHRVCLCLGSNVEPEKNLRSAVELLRARGRVLRISTAWESAAVGSGGPNFLNACALFTTRLAAPELVDQVIRPIESSLGRRRSADRSAPRQIDIDIVLYDEQPLRLEYWEQAFMIVPLSELLPEFRHPLTHEPLASIAGRLRLETWLEPRPSVLPVLES